MTTRREAIRTITSQIEPLYGEHEARQIALIILSETVGISISELLSDINASIQMNDIERMTEELTTGRPVQYVIGNTEFCGVKIGVHEGVLIPRPETEELVAWITQEATPSARILDIGTGSGCIAIALKHALPEAVVHAIDISEEALRIAHNNATMLNLEVDFRRANALATPPSSESIRCIFDQQFEIIVSNPPYIPQAESTDIRLNVMGFEPSTALFVPDNDPLCFYRAIAHASHDLLTAGGKLYFEIHERYGHEVCELLHNEGYHNVTLRCDFLDKPRMVCCRKNQ